MSDPVDTKDPVAVEAAVQAAYEGVFPEGDATLVSRVFACVTKCFWGHCPDYLAIDTCYHDLEHTLQGTLCMVRLLTARHRAGVLPQIDQRLFELGLLAILLHDTGYAKKSGDLEGTGAKYTFTHVDRSVEFAARLLGAKDFPTRDVQAVQHMIHCTGWRVDLAAIPFAGEVERLVGYALGTGDLVGQMAADDYVDKLPSLFAEFAEAIAFTGTRPEGIDFRSADDLIRRTPEFWCDHVWGKIDHDFQGLYRFLENPYPGGPNEYLDRIEANLDRIRRLCLHARHLPAEARRQLKASL